MRLFLFFVAAQMMGNGIACLIAAAAWHFTRRRLVAINTTSRCLCDGDDEVTPC